MSHLPETEARQGVGMQCRCKHIETADFCGVLSLAGGVRLFGEKSFLFLACVCTLPFFGVCVFEHLKDKKADYSY